MLGPDIEKEEFIDIFKFLRLPLGWAGESFTKIKLLVYFLMQDRYTKEYKIYEIIYTMPMTYKFIKKAWESIELRGNEIKVKNKDKLSELILNWDGDEKEVIGDLKFNLKENINDLAEVMLEMITEAEERGWKKV